MAVIKCPECGETVSSTVNKCVHCGYEYAVCPECKSAVESNAVYCTVCGYVFKENAGTMFEENIKVEAEAEYGVEVEAEQKKPEEAPKKPKMLCRSLQEIWKEGNRPTISKVFDKIDTIFTVIFVVSIAFILGAVFCKTVNIFEGQTSEMMAVGAILFGLSAAFANSDIFEAIAKLIDVKSFWNWCKTNNYDLAEMHREEIESICNKNADECAVQCVRVRGENQLSIDTLYYNSAAANGASIIVVAALKMFGFGAISGLLVNAVIDNIHITSLDFSSMNSVGKLSAWLILDTVLILVFFIVKKVQESKKDKMIQKIEKAQ